MSFRAGIFGGLSVLLAGAAVWELTRPIDLAPASKSFIVEKSPSISDEFEVPLPATDAYAVISERPVFSQTRRPPPPQQSVAPAVAPAPPSKPAPVPPPNITLLGTIIEPSQRLVVLRPGNSPTAMLLREGEPINGWVVEKISGDRIVLRDGDRHEEILFPKPSTVGPSAAAPPRALSGLSGNRPQ